MPASGPRPGPPPAGRREISGRTRLYAVLGDPVGQVKAPGLLNPVFAGLGVDAVLVPVHAPAARLADVVRGLSAIANLDGLLVTVPHKFAMCALADARSETAELLGSANALRRRPDGSWYADNFDGAGFVSGLRAAGHDPRGLRVALVGAGGAGVAVAAALLAAGAAHVAACDPDPARLDSLRDRLGAWWPGRVTVSARPRLAGADLAVNATPLGLRPDDPLPFSPEGLPAGAMVADIIMEPHETPLLRAATACGLPVQHGIHMLRRQIELYTRFFGVAAAQRV